MPGTAQSVSAFQLSIFKFSLFFYLFLTKFLQKTFQINSQIAYLIGQSRISRRSREKIKYTSLMNRFQLKSSHWLNNIVQKLWRFLMARSNVLFWLMISLVRPMPSWRIPIWKKSLELETRTTSNKWNWRKVWNKSWCKKGFQRIKQLAALMLALLLEIICPPSPLRMYSLTTKRSDRDVCSLRRMKCWRRGWGQSRLLHKVAIWRELNLWRERLGLQRKVFKRRVSALRSLLILSTNLVRGQCFVLRMRLQTRSMACNSLSWKNGPKNASNRKVKTYFKFLKLF